MKKLEKRNNEATVSDARARYFHNIASLFIHSTVDTITVCNSWLHGSSKEILGALFLNRNRFERNCWFIEEEGALVKKEDAFLAIFALPNSKLIRTPALCSRGEVKVIV